MKKVYIKDYGKYYDSVTILHRKIIYVVIHKRVKNGMCWGGTKEIMSRSRKEIAKFIKKYRWQIKRSMVYYRQWNTS